MTSEAHITNHDVQPVVTTVNAPVEVVGHRVDVKRETKKTSVTVEGHGVRVNEILKETTVPVIGHDIRVAEDLIVTQAHVTQHRVEPILNTVTTEIRVDTPVITLKEVREEREVVINIPEPRLILKKVPYDLEVDLPQPPQQPKRDIITQTGGDEPPSPGSAADDALTTQTGGDEPPSPGSAADDALTDAEPVGSYSEEEADRESDPLLVIRRYPTPPGRDGQESRSEDGGEEEEEDEDEDDWDGMETPRRTMLQQLKRIKKPRDVQRFICRWSRRPFPNDLDELDNVIYTCWARRRWTGAAQWPCPFCQGGAHTQRALELHLEERHSERLPGNI